MLNFLLEAQKHNLDYFAAAISRRLHVTKYSNLIGGTLSNGKHENYGNLARPNSPSERGWAWYEANATCMLQACDLHVTSM